MDDILDEKTYETRTVEFASFSLRTTAFMTDLLIFGAVSFGLNYAFELQSSYLIFLKVPVVLVLMHSVYILLCMPLSFIFFAIA